MTTPTTWEQGAAQASERILAEFDSFPNTWLNTPDSAVLTAVYWDIARLREAAEDPITGKRALQLTRSLANNALELLYRRATFYYEREGWMRREAAYIVTLAAGKQADYGTENILSFGETGVIVRMSDKVARLRNLWEKGRAAANESLDDTLRDIYGYAVVFDMLLADTFTLPLEAQLAQLIPEELPIIPLPGSDGWERAYHWGSELDRRFPEQDAENLAMACQYNSWGPLEEHRVVGLVMEQQGWHDGDNWFWRVTLDNDETWTAEGGCDYTGWDCQSDLEWKRVGVDHAIEADLVGEMEGLAGKAGLAWPDTQHFRLDEQTLSELWKQFAADPMAYIDHYWPAGEGFPVIVDADVPANTIYFLDPSRMHVEPSSVSFNDMMREVFGGTTAEQGSLYELLTAGAQ